MATETEKTMLAQLINSLGCEIDTVDLRSKEAAIRYMQNNWLRNLAEGDRIQIVCVYEGELAIV